DEIDDIAKFLARWKAIPYSQAMREAMLANPLLAQTYCDFPVRDAFAKVYAVTSALQKVSNIITGTPRQDDGRLDMSAVLSVLELFGDLSRQAAEEGLTGLAKKAVINRPGHVDQLMPTAVDEVRRRYPALRRMAETGEVSEEALRILCPQF